MAKLAKRTIAIDNTVGDFLSQGDLAVSMLILIFAVPSLENLLLNTPTYTSPPPADSI
jgi:hypothetical protein